MYIAAYLISGILKGIRGHWTVEVLLKKFYHSFPEMFMLRLTTSINGVAWFVSALLPVSVLLYALLRIDKRHTFQMTICPLFSLLVYGRFNQVLGRIHSISSQTVFPILYDGIWRAAAGMSLGIFACTVVREMKGCVQTARAKDACKAFGHFGLVTVLLVSVFKYHSFSDFWFIWIAFFSFVFLFLAEGARSCQEKIGCIPKTVCYLGSLSYPLYLLHEAVYGVFITYHPVGDPVLGCVAIVAVSLLEAVFLTWILDRLNQYLNKKVRFLFGG